MKFDYKAFAKAILKKQLAESVKQNKWFTVRELGAQTKINFTTSYRMTRTKKTDLDSILKMCEWLKQPITKFIK